MDHVLFLLLSIFPFFDSHMFSLFSLLTWDSRNEFIYGSPVTHPVATYKHTLLVEAAALQQALSGIADPIADQWCFVAPNILRAHSVLSLRQWLRLARNRLSEFPSPTTPLIDLPP